MEASSMNASLGRAAAALLLTAGFGLAQAADMTVTLSGAQEVPPVATDAKGTGKITIGMDKAVGGRITTTGIAGTAAHIHVGALGTNGPVLITLTKASDNEWVVPPGSKLTDEQYTAYKADKLYVNVHSDAYKPGEIRAQLKP
jgi:CHRD domain